MKQLSLVFLIGAMSALSMAPYNFTPAILIALGLLYVKAEKSSSGRYSALLGFIFSLGYFGFSLSWIGNALLVEDNPYWWAWPLAVSGLPIILSTFNALALYLHFIIKQKTSKPLSAISFVILMTLAEMARGTLFTGFPWNLFGYTWISVMPIAQIAGLYNIYLLSSLTIFWAVSLGYYANCQTTKISKNITLTFAITSFIMCYIYGLNKIQASPIHHINANIVLVQPNIKQSEKWDNNKRQKHFADIIELSRATINDSKEATLIVWPETAIAQDILNAPWAINMIRETLQSYENEAFLITGALRYKDKKYYNSIVTFNKNAEIIEIYDKSHLVPFGEYMPLSNIFDIAPIVGFSGFEKGKENKKITLSDKLSFTPKICYEIIFPEKETLISDMIINVTNDAWYGVSAGPYQHLVQTKFRAIETQKTVIRAANTGISAIITPLGFAEKSIELNKRATIQNK